MKRISKLPEIIELPGGATYLRGTKALITFNKSNETRDFFNETRLQPLPIKVGEKDYEIVPWGSDNNLPHRITERVYEAEVVASNILFNIQTGYGQGIIPVKYETDTQGNRTPRPYYENEEINDFLEQSDVNGYLLEQLTDMKIFFNVFPEIILNKKGDKIVNIYSKEAEFSRWGKMNKHGVVENHFYSAQWASGIPGNITDGQDEVVVTPVLDARFPLQDLRNRMSKGSSSPDFRFVVPVSFPTPGRMYYQKPYWWSIFLSGWYDYLTMIPKYKKKLISELSVIRYHVELSTNYFQALFSAEKITDYDEQKKRQKKEFEDLNKFLSSNENANKTILSYTSFTPDGIPQPSMKITKIDDNIKGGEFIEDSEEASNIICYAMGVHPSLIGASPGKNKTINGTEARELFLIKQVIERPFRDRLLMPLHLVKHFNKWPKDVYFYIPDINLVTLDKSSNGTTSTLEKPQNKPANERPK